MTACRARWDTINGERFKGGSCPTCGQPLPKGKLEASQAAFEKDKERRKSEAVEAANRAKATLAGVQADIAKLEQEATEDLKQADSLTAQLKALEGAQRPEISDMDGYASRKAELEAQAAEAQKELDGLTASTTARQKVLRDALADVDQELERLGGELAKKTALEYSSKRMEELREQAAAASD